jgi:hypothetical protein
MCHWGLAYAQVRSLVGGDAREGGCTRQACYTDTIGVLWLVSVRYALDGLSTAARQACARTCTSCQCGRMQGSNLVVSAHICLVAFICIHAIIVTPH